MKKLHIVFRDSKWFLKYEGAARHFESHPTKKSALTSAKLRLKNIKGGGNYILHKSNGQFEQGWSYRPKLIISFKVGRDSETGKINSIEPFPTLKSGKKNKDGVGSDDPGPMVSK